MLYVLFISTINLYSSTHRLYIAINCSPKYWEQYNGEQVIIVEEFVEPAAESIIAMYKRWIDE